MLALAANWELSPGLQLARLFNNLRLGGLLPAQWANKFSPGLKL